MPIIQSLLDTDFYKLMMGQLVFKLYADIPVKYAFKNRTKDIRLADIIDETELRRELDHVRTLRFNNSELHYLRGTNEYQERMFAEDYLMFLKNLQLPEYHLEIIDGNYKLEFSGHWAKAIYWEIPALAIVNELYFRGLMKNKSRFEKDHLRAEGIQRLSNKINLLHWCPNIIFTDFGTRRRFSRPWQDYVVRTMAQELPKQFIGTSNTALAMKYGLLPMGTSAHEMDMVAAAAAGKTDRGILRAHQRVLRNWWKQYGWGLSIALTDTFGTDFFFRDMTTEQAHSWKGLRQDSGDPIVFGEKAIAFYKKRGVDPRDKLLIFSDGLDIAAMMKISMHFAKRIKVTFGWGTNLTNDVGLKPLSLVIKIVEANGHPAVKLSDNLAKAIGDPAEVERYKHIFGYTQNYYEECKY
ncbi:MAG: nicotinate phosphoribosyltransferase [Candidatus Portnoybacteria bacterium CG09_land_8_20_14_0_10_44_13]|uniref:Nicotinate phosphoribosyltransferase n=1 Tax=Candidatus Portnoybacteria bacterium CG09_land_8_20_14_0_10_44_13 TaxID=1974811 RepID=A0A2H0WWF6_9BACT|nr:MAG: nicotinate phosphoribosyltransferase [Candidatus Portnoybacteria bacterium CG09_land_8_20_14_0_10_44_13]